ncbi:prefoldin subunit [Candidatus Marsarchaeota archaeon]|nr:prefoldin subunit [Candidatus Marsarchaeota archaeon]
MSQNTNPAGQDKMSEQEMEKLLRDYQILQEQIRSFAIQLDQLHNQKGDLERAKEEIDNASGKIYITVGGVIVETSKESASKDIEERSELTETRITSMTKQYTELRNKEKQYSERIMQAYKQNQLMS